MENNNDYDYFNAILAGLSPDEEGHWQSRVGKGNQEGLILKSMEHPTLLNTLVDEINKGYMYWYKDPEEKRMYTYNKIEDALKKMITGQFNKPK